MKGDFSRRTFDTDKHYSAVLQEQGRMLTDADLEEEHRILAHRIETGAADLIGGCGGPTGAAGFEITDTGAEVQISAGRYYVAGVLVENEADVDFTDQPHRPDATWPPEGGAGRHLAILDVWRRLVTALDDPSIREVALGGPTTAAREQTIWQVRAALVDDDATCLDPLPDMGGTTGQMAVQADPEAAPADPCEVPPSAGFKGLENQFYRVEVHDTGDAYDMTAAPDLFEITGFPTDTTNQVEMALVGDLAAGQAVEIFAQATPLASSFAHITDVDGNTVTLSSDLSGFSVDDDPFLRRVEATFVWSRDNGSILTTVERIDGEEITVHDLGRDEVLGFAPGQWVELSDDRDDLEMRPGQLLRIEAIDMARRVVILTTPAQQLDPAAPDGSGVNPDWHPKLRRWDGAGAIRTNNADAEDDWIHLEDGVQVRFTPGRYRTDDYWHFPARTAVIDPALGNIEWPRDPAGDPELLPPHGVEHHYCPLALVDLVQVDDETIVVDDVTDCRDLFPPVTQLTNLFYVGGDGQEGLPDPADPGSRSVDLGAPLQVRVANGSFPVEGATVRFTIDAASNGRLQGTMSKTADVETNADGVATCVWQLDGSTAVQFCEARLLNVASNPFDHQAVNFHATLSTADRVAYDPTDCPDLAGVRTVQEALDALCRRDPGGRERCCCIVIGPGGDFEDIQTALDAMRERDERDICLCLIPGDHELPGLFLTAEDAERPWNLSIAGCGPGTRLDLLDDLRLIGLNGFTLHGLDIAVRQGATIHARQCRSVDIDRCRISGLPLRAGLVRIQLASRIYVGNSTFESFSREELEGAINFLDGIPELQDLYTLAFWREFERRAREVAIDLSQRDPGDRFGLAGELLERLAGNQGFISSGEAAAYRRLAETLFLEEVDPLALLDHLIAIRLAVLRVDPGVALEIGEMIRDQEDRLSSAGTRDGAAVIENNDIAGLVSFYGLPGADRDFDVSALRRLQGLFREEVVRLGALDLGVHVRDNRLTKFVLGEEFFRVIMEMIDRGEGELSELISSFHCTDNIIDGATSELVAHHLSLASNQFSLSAVRGVDPGATLTVRVADIIGDTSVYTGNHSARRGFGVDFIAQIFDATRASAEAANLELTIL